MDPRYIPREWEPHEKPTFPGSPSTPLHPTRRRIIYAAIGVLVAMTGGLSNALVTANLPNLQGALGAYAWQMQWLPAAFVMTSMSANLLLVKFRQQYGLRLFTEIFLVLYVLIAAAHLFVHGLGSAIAVRAAHGLCGAALSSLGIYYMIQAFPTKHRLKALAIALGLTQLPIPLARIFSTELLQLAEWRGLYMFELGLALMSLAAVLAVKLPPSDRIKVFEPLDFVTFITFALGAGGLAVVLSFGRTLWWTQTPWLGAVLAVSIALLCIAGAVEHGRRNPMINMRWLASGELAKLAASVLLIRICLSEQSTGAVAFFQQLGLSNEQMGTMSMMVLAGCISGIVISALTLRPTHLAQPLIVSVALIAIGAFMDSRATSLTRPPQMYLSQFLIGLGSTLFIAPAMISGFGKVIAQPKNLISFIVLFGMAQTMGGLLGSAMLGTFQTVREKFHANQLAEHISLLDPEVAARVQAYAASHAQDIADPAQRQLIAWRMLGQAVTREANVLAYNDVFLLIGWLAIATLAWLLADLVLQRRRARRDGALPTTPIPARP